MEIRPKSSDELQAQAETSLHMPMKDNTERLTILKTLRETISEGHVPDTNSLEYKKYVAYLRSIGGLRAEEIQDRIGHLQDYAEFADAVAGLKAEIAAVDDIKNIPSCLGHGANTYAFLIEQNGKKYVARLRSYTNQKNLEKYPDYSSGEYYIQMEVGLGVPNLEQVVAFSREDGVTISEYVDGTVGDKLTMEDCEHIPAWQFVDITKTFLKTSELGVHIDFKYSNYIYSHQTGFTVIDYHTMSEGDRQGPMIQIEFFLNLLSSRPHQSFELRTMVEPEYYEQIVRGSHEVVVLLGRYKDAIEHSDIDTVEKLLIVEMVDSRISQNITMAEQYADPRYVQSQIAHFTRENKLRAQRDQNPQWDIGVVD